MPANDAPILYFAYGSNIPSSRLLGRCRGAAPLGPAWLEGWHLAFSYYATIRPDAGARVPGVVWQLTESDLAALDRYEGYPRQYRRERVEVGLFSGQTIETWVYVMNRDPDVAPEEWYVDLLRDGYEEWGLPLRSLTEALAHARRVGQR